MNRYINAHIRSALLLAAIALVTFVGEGIGRADSIWNQAGGRATSLYVPSRGEYKIGDILTILIVENTSATNTASLDTDKETEHDLEFDQFDDILGLTSIFGRPLSVNPNFGLSAESGFESDASSKRSFVITGTVSGQVTEVLANYNLRIEAMQKIEINGEGNSVIVVGTIRPQDITSENTILSTQIANVEIKYFGKGPLTNTQNRGIITEFLEFIWPF